MITARTTSFQNNVSVVCCSGGYGSLDAVMQDVTHTKRQTYKYKVVNQCVVPV